MAACTGQQIGKLLCDALGLDGDKVESIQISVAANELVKVNVTQSVYVKEAEDIVRILSNYNLVIAEDE